MLHVNPITNKASTWPPRCDLVGRDHIYGEDGKCKECKRLSIREKKKRKSKLAKKWNESNAYYRRTVGAAYYKANKERMDEANRRWRDENPERYAMLVHRSKLLRKYGMTLDQYDDMLMRQGGVCLICKGQSPILKELCVDHDHETGQVRGILCHQCNLWVGQVEKALKQRPQILAHIGWTTCEST